MNIYVSLPKNGKIRQFPLSPEIEDVLTRVKKVELKRVGCLNLYFLMLMVVFMHV